MRYRNPFRDERGFTTTSMVLSLLITLALVFSAAQVYRIGSLSAEVQDVADAAALAAENQVAEFMIVARFCDAVVLSLSLASLTTFGLGIAALCTPVTAELSASLIEAAGKLLETRDRFSDRATQVLNKLQEALPFFAAASAAGVAAANDANSGDARYIGVALLVPSKGDALEPQSSEASEKLAEDVEANADEIRQKAREAEEAAQQANEAKQAAFMRDCGDSPGYCMHERAASLAGLAGAENPLYSSIDTWSFSVAFERAKRYFANRSYDDTPSGNTAEDMARLQLQRRYCSYVYDLLSREGYVNESTDGFSANFPHVPNTMGAIRETSLYTDPVYPISEEPVEGDPEGDPLPVMHAWSGCPGITRGIATYNSIDYMVSANLPTCPVCSFTEESMGRIASANTSIDSGFEFHYEAVAREASRYQEARERANGPAAEVRERTSSLFDELAQALEEALDKRIDVTPPGSYGSLAFVVNTGATSAAGGFASGFVASAGSLGPRAAISAATLLDEGSEEGRTVINSMLDGLREDGGAATGALGIVLDAWSGALSVYADGYDAITGGIESALDNIPLVGASGLGTWAAGKLKSAVGAVGLEPAKLQALKPVLVNSAHVAARDEGVVGQRLVAVKQRVVAHPLYSTDLFSSMLTAAEREALDKVDGLGDSVDIASIELFGDGGPSIPITIPLPPAVEEFGAGGIMALFDRIRSYHAQTVEVRAWE